MLNSKNNMPNKPPFYTHGRAGGKRGIPVSGERGRSTSISKVMSRFLRRYCLDGMDDEGWTPMKTILRLGELIELSTTVDDIFRIVNGSGGNYKMRFELSVDRKFIRCAQGHSVGSGVRSNCLPVTTTLEYVVHGTTFEAAAQIVESGLSRQERLRIHFYECDRRGAIVGGMQLRRGSEVAIVLSARHCMDDGIVFHRAANNVILSEGIGGIIGTQYFCFVHKIHRDPMKRSIIWERQGGWDHLKQSVDQRPRKLAQDYESEIEDDQTMYTAQSGEQMRTPQSMLTDDQYPRTPALRDIAGLNPFSPDSDGELPGVSMIQEEMTPSSCVSQEMELADVKGEKSMSSFDTARMTDDELSNPPPSKAAKRDTRTKEEEEGPIFATFKVRNRLTPRPPYIPPVQRLATLTAPRASEASSSSQVPFTRPPRFKSPPAELTQSLREKKGAEKAVAGLKKPSEEFDELSPTPTEDIGERAVASLQELSKEVDELTQTPTEEIRERVVAGLKELSKELDELSPTPIDDGSGLITGMSSYQDRPSSEAMYKWWQHPDSEHLNEQEAQFRDKWSRNMCPACMYIKGHSDQCNLEEWETRQEVIPVAPSIKSKPPTPKSKSISASPCFSLFGTPRSSANGSPMHGSVADIVTPSSRGNLSVLLTNMDLEARRETGSRPVTPRTKAVDTTTLGPPGNASPPVFGG